MSRNLVPPVSIVVLKERLHYDPVTGIWTWLKWHCAGERAGTVDPHGYRRIWLSDRQCRSARLAWYYMTGEWPDMDIDHIDMDTGNDAWSNLRLATNAQNRANTVAAPKNRLGVKGVYLRRGGYVGVVGHRGRNYYTRTRPTIEEAKTARDALAKELHGEFFRP